MTSAINNNCRFILEKFNNFGFIKDKNVSTHRKILTIDKIITDLKFFSFLNIYY